MTIVGVHPDGTSPEEVEQVLGEAKLGYPTVVTPLNAAKSKEAAIVGYPRNVVPYYVLVDADGQVTAHGFLSDDRLTIKLDELREAGQSD
ncbi:TlpA family protein disulfide reductase [Candidatus Laterigemmans baculatus]|uniref:TlpA family protein disulfide reductase n=1 Tax=Candidatus Laterigemmans baculatus TaxID=2770505 RepID=UPI0013DC4EB7|nr:hypothetical protein [Candidatus Laterigemmans baculatus]